MKLSILGSGSSGNCYIIQNDKEALIIECGVNIGLVKKALDFNVSKVSGCVSTHRHSDHFGKAKDIIGSGIDLYASGGTFENSGLSGHHVKIMKSLKKYHIGNFMVVPFDVKHDVPEPFGFLIDHPETGRLLFLTDSFYVPQTFSGLNHILVEVNYDPDILDHNTLNGSIPAFVRNRILSSHMSIDTCLDMLKANDLTNVNNIVLLHLSDGNSDEKSFIDKVKNATGKNVIAANKGMEINFDKVPF